MPTRNAHPGPVAAAPAPASETNGIGSAGAWAAGAVVAAVLLWSHWSMLRALWRDWDSDPNYSVGRLVPLAALYLLWQDRRGLAACRLEPCLWGFALLLAGLAGRFYGLLYLFESAERYSFVLTIAGLTLLIAGKQVLWRVRWILAFLLLMAPLPGKLHNLISSPLQEWAASGSVFVLELAGVEVAREGNVLILNYAVPIGIAEACSGLRMLTAFVVVAAVFAFLVDRPRWQRATLLISSVPVAIICNIARVAATAGLYLAVDSRVAETFFHDFAGITMMPIAIALLVGELWLLNRLVTPDTPAPRAAARR